MHTSFLYLKKRSTIINNKASTMSGLKIYERMESVKRLIELKATGSPKMLAGKFSISERTVYRIIDDLRLITGKEIEYSNLHKSYIFRKA